MPLPFDPQQVKQAFSHAAAHYEAHAELQALIRNEALAAAAQHWPEHGHILDVGTATGQIVSDAAIQQLKLKFTGVDIAFGMCVLANEQLPVANAAAESLPFAENVFDGAFSSLMLQWATAPQTAFAEMHRVLKPGGRAVITTFVAGTLNELAEVFASLDTTPHVSDFLPPAQVSALAAHAGFALLDAEQETFTEYYDTAASLMREIKAIGAANKAEKRSRGLMTPRKLAEAEKRYREHFGHKRKGIPATWNALRLILEKR
ncbi:MAG: methyltransferase domain-containing protein [Rickettsiales bacterium]|nr:methyltransferase domain-containing protein [Rickettsiales bacterium]